MRSPRDQIIGRAASSVVRERSQSAIERAPPCKWGSNAVSTRSQAVRGAPGETAAPEPRSCGCKSPMPEGHAAAGLRHGSGHELVTDRLGAVCALYRDQAFHQSDKEAEVLRRRGLNTPDRCQIHGQTTGLMRSPVVAGNCHAVTTHPRNRPRLRAPKRGATPPRERRWSRRSASSWIACNQAVGRYIASRSATVARNVAAATPSTSLIMSLRPASETSEPSEPSASAATSPTQTHHTSTSFEPNRAPAGEPLQPTRRPDRANPLLLASGVELVGIRLRPGDVPGRVPECRRVRSPDLRRVERGAARAATAKSVHSPSSAAVRGCEHEVHGGVDLAAGLLGHGDPVRDRPSLQEELGPDVGIVADRGQEGRVVEQHERRVRVDRGSEDRSGGIRKGHGGGENLGPDSCTESAGRDRSVWLEPKGVHSKPMAFTGSPRPIRPAVRPAASQTAAPPTPNRHPLPNSGQLSPMKFGIYHFLEIPRPWEDDTEAVAVANALEQIKVADRLGFHSSWAVEHHFTEEYSHLSRRRSPRRCRRPDRADPDRSRRDHHLAELQPPLPDRKRVATLDLVSKGRVDFGSGESSTRSSWAASVSTRPSNVNTGRRASASRCGRSRRPRSRATRESTSAYRLETSCPNRSRSLTHRCGSLAHATRRSSSRHSMGWVSCRSASSIRNGPERT